MADEKTDVASARAAALVTEIATTTVLIANFLKTADQVLAVTVAALVGLGTYTSRLKPETADAVLTAMPLIVTLAAAYALRAIATIDSLGRYRADLEQTLADEVGLKNIFWETRHASRLKRSAPYRVAEIAFMTITAVVFAAGGVAGYHWLVAPPSGLHSVRLSMAAFAYAVMAGALLYAWCGLRSATSTIRPAPTASSLGAAPVSAPLAAHPDSAGEPLASHHDL